MRESWKGNFYLLTLIVSFFYVAASYNACSDVQFQNARNEALTDKQEVKLPSVKINGGAEFTNESLVNLSLYSDGAYEMRISEDPSCEVGEWEPFQTEKAWNLSASNSEAIVFVIYRDEEGGVTDCVRDDIVHDDVSPFVSYAQVQNIYTNQSSYQLDFTVQDNLSGVERTQCSESLGAEFSDCDDSKVFDGLTEGAKSFYVKASDKAGNVSVPVPYTWTVDQTPPTVVLNKKPPEITNIQQDDILFSGQDNLSGVAVLECKQFAGTANQEPDWQACSNPFNYNLEEGMQRFKLRAMDYANNVSDEIDYEWRIDITAPTVSISDHPAQYSNDSNPGFGFSGMDQGQPLVGYKCQLGDAGYEPCESGKQYNNQTQNQYVFRVIGVDQAGNESEPAEYSWTIDLTPPSVEILEKPAAYTKLSSAQFTFQAEDDGSEVDRTECSIDDGSFEACSGPVNYFDLAEGSHLFRVRAYDLAGNVSAIAEHSWQVDTTAPVVEFIATPQPLTSEVLAHFEFTATDEGGSGVVAYECKLDNAADYSSCQSPKDFLGPLVEGQHIFYVRATDSAGNTSDPAAYYPWTIDSTGPVITFLSYPMVPLREADSAELLFTVSDVPSGVASYSCLYQGQPFANCMMDQQIEIIDQEVGVHIFRVSAEDALGNSSSLEVSWTVLQDGVPVTQYTDVTSDNKVDILFVVDNSGSMEEDQQNLGSKIDGFLSRITELDWQIGVTTTDIGDENGKLLAFEGLGDHYFINSTMDISTAQSALADTIEMGTGGSGREEGIYAAYRSVQRFDEAGQFNNNHRAFFRQNANLAVVVLSDEDETSHDPDHFNQPTQFLSYINNRWPSKNFAWSSIIIRPGDQTCFQIQANAGSRTQTYGVLYSELTSLTGGLLGDICASNYTPMLENIGDNVVELQRSITLQCSPLDLDDDGVPDIGIEYRENDSSDFTSFLDLYTLDGLRITFDSVLPAGEFKLSYECTQAP